jgi:replicative DNA helicase
MAASEHARTILAAIIPARKDLLQHALQHLEEEHFRDEIQGNIWRLLYKYYDVAGDVLPPKTLTDLLTRQEIEETKQLLYEETYKDLVDFTPPDHEYRYAVDALKDQRARVRTGEALTAALEILDDGAEVEGEKLKGHEDARMYITTQISVIDRLNHQEAAPEGDMRREGGEVLQDYADRKSGKIKAGITTGIKSFDLATGGIHNGEFFLFCAYTGQGKSQFATQTAWHVATQLGKNVYISTSETTRVQLRRRLVCRHSRLPQFGLPGGINVRDLRDGTLSPKEEEALKDVVYDLDKNPGYGRVHTAQVPRGAPISMIESRMKRQGEQWEIHFGINDYLGLVRPDRHRQSQREEHNDVLKEGAMMCKAFYDGQGIPFVSPWQMSQAAYKLALQTGGYGLGSLAETSEAEKSADGIAALLRNPETPKEATLQFLKLRDSEAPPPITLKIDYKNSYLGDEDSAAAGLEEAGEEDDDFLAMLDNS